MGKSRRGSKSLKAAQRDLNRRVGAVHKDAILGEIVERMKASSERQTPDDAEMSSDKPDLGWKARMKRKKPRTKKMKRVKLKTPRGFKKSS